MCTILINPSVHLPRYHSYLSYGFVSPVLIFVFIFCVACQASEVMRLSNFGNWRWWE
jgi:hypothetical protein